LNPEEQASAAIIHQALGRAKTAYKEGERSASRLEILVRSTIELEPRARVDYVQVVEADSLEHIERIDERPVLIAVAAYIGKTRLIDNVILNKVKKTEPAKA
jgi:pantoate--beta-alanine ligase